MHFKLSKSAKNFFSNIINPEGSHAAEDKNKFIQFDVYYCCALIGMAAVQIDEETSDLSDMVEKYPNGIFVVQNPPQEPLTQEEMDAVYELPYMRTYHPSYEEKGGVPAINEIKFSLTSNRGCFGGCNFCALTFHQGRTIQTRSHESIIKEAKQVIAEKDFKGYIHDVGGPTANFRHPSCEKQMKFGVCKNKQCLFPTPCKNKHLHIICYTRLFHVHWQRPQVVFSKLMLKLYN